MLRALLSDIDIDDMYKRLTTVHIRYGILWKLGILSGLRISDLLKLRRNDIDRPILEVIEQKSGKYKAIEIDPDMRQLLNQYFAACYIRNDDCLFWRRQNCRRIPMSRQWANHIIASTASYLQFEGIGAHSMRKIYACKIYRSSGSLEAVQRALNHGKVETTLIYLRDILNTA